MSASTVRHPKGPPVEKPDRTAVPFLWAFFDSSVGAKITVAFTGLGLVTFVIFHMIGNLKVFDGPDSINAYAHFLKHDLGLLLWIARAGLLALFVLHLTLAIRLTLRSRAARPVDYAYPLIASGPLNTFRFPIMWKIAKVASPSPVSATVIFAPTLESRKAHRNGPAARSGGSAGPLGCRTVVADIGAGMSLGSGVRLAVF